MTMCLDNIQMSVFICSSIAGTHNWIGLQWCKFSLPKSHLLQNNLLKQVAYNDFFLTSYK